MNLKFPSLENISKRLSKKVIIFFLNLLTQPKYKTKPPWNAVAYVQSNQWSSNSKCFINQR